MAIQTVRSGATEHPEEMFDFMLTHIIDQSGVKSIDAEGDLYVSENDTPNMSVNVNFGYAFLSKSDGSRTYPVRLYSDVENLAVSANSSGNPRIDAVVLYADLGAEPNATATNVAKVEIITGTPAVSPVAPTDNDIQTAVGAGYPFLRLANIAVGSGATEIENANITDTRVRALNIKHSAVYEVNSDGATITFDVEKRSNQVTLGGNRILAVKNYQAGDEFIIKLIQDGTGSRTVTWWSGIDWDGGMVSLLTPVASRADVFGFKVKTDGRFEGYILGQGMTLS